MKYNPEIHKRKSIRLKHYDYSKEGMYFITICTKNRINILSNIISVGGDAHIAPKEHINQKIKIQLQPEGKIVKKYIENINVVYGNICVKSYVIMPNHLHMIICVDNSGAMRALPPTKKMTIPKIIQSLKILVTKEIGYSIWQRNYYEHIIRNEKEYYQICQYIEQNPTKWIKLHGSMPTSTL